MKPIPAAAQPEYEFSIEITTGISAPPIGIINKKPIKNDTANNIQNKVEDWVEMWKQQVKLGCIPYYMFVARDTGAQDYFAVTLENAWKVYKEAYSKVSGIARTVRGPSMSTNPGKVQILGINEINNEKVFVLRFIQGRNPNWVGRPFFAKYDSNAIWLTDLVPYSSSEQFFFEEKMNKTPY